MPEQKIEMKVGAFVLAGVAVIAASILLLGQNQMLFRSHFELKAEFTQAQGIVVGSLVSLAGVQVGNVTKIDVTPSAPTVTVVMSLDKSYQGKITSDATASIKTQGALGDKYIYITQADSGTPLPDGGKLASDSQPDLFEALSEKSEGLSSIGDLVKELTVLLKNMNEENRSASLMENLSQAGKNLARISGDPHLKQSLARLDSILKKIDEGDGALGRLVNDPTLHEKLLELLGEPSRNRYLKPLIRESIRQSQGHASSSP